MLVATYHGKKFADASAVLWNTGDWTAQTISGYGSAAFSRDSQLLALGGTEIKLIDPGSRKELRRIELPAFTKAELPALTKGEVLPNSATRSDAMEKIPCGVSALAISPDNTTVAGGCFEGTLRILNLKMYITQSARKPYSENAGSFSSGCAAHNPFRPTGSWPETGWCELKRFCMDRRHPNLCDGER
jgi:WD40 repeat protein